MIPKTKKAAKEDGMLTMSMAFSKHLIPIRNAKSLNVKGEDYYPPCQCEEIISQAEARRRRLRIPDTAEPVKTFCARMEGKTIYYDTYRASDCVPMRPRAKEIPPVEIDLLKATYTANKAAKRFRDNARSFYSQRLHGFARYASEKKYYLYRLKESGIIEAYSHKRLSFCGTHGNMGLYRGEGYCFHSPYVPAIYEYEDDEQEYIFVESSPKGTREGRLKDAVFTLGNLPHETQDFHYIARSTINLIDERDDHTESCDEEEYSECEEEYIEEESYV